jgi:hypothetical protein
MLLLLKSTEQQLWLANERMQQISGEYTLELIVRAVLPILGTYGHTR